ncbi:anaerobic coproporphyrinogen III oxidase [Antricoccus suffuscus]|uniref:Heme chaperone HemW n=1 Tax=Antricoccus suffuscus TaxID=1629062 RepID=A0A2T0Z4Y3_9ACTN|nr:radical SAM family heme chaperone HemW [Antricoccus suffuscus]PRZ31393.1 anaerobic coproporphyrinogen III oxidase [Antricoccus suffuscus]
MPSTLPQGEIAPLDGALPESAKSGAASTPFGFYLHVPFCATRCGYCDFNTYTASELTARDGSATVSQSNYIDLMLGEIRMARQILGDQAPPVQTIFVGGGTPSLLPADHLASAIREIYHEFDVADDVEITTEANPESVSPSYLRRLRESGFTRLSLGMQSAVPHVLRVLDRTHTPGRALEAVAEARSAGFEHVNLDLIYGSPGESDEDWQTSLDAALSAGPDHVSAYALIVEEGTALAGKIARGHIPAPDDDVLADRYEQADLAMRKAGLLWYEVSNWATDTAARCRHNEIYWQGGNWWGVGPGAHSHVGGVRWWNVKHPAAYASRLEAGLSPAHGRERLDERQRRMEYIMLQIRLRAGLPVDDLDGAQQQTVEEMVGYGLLQRDEHANRRAVLTLRGRLLADAVIRSLVS